MIYKFIVLALLTLAVTIVYGEQPNLKTLNNYFLNNQISTGVSKAQQLLGPISSGGGMGVVCNDPQGKVLSVELLDLWEAKNLYQRYIPKSNKRVEDLVLEGLSNLKYSLDSKGEAIWLGGAPTSSPPTLQGAEALFENLRKEAAMFLDKNSYNPYIRRLRGVELTLTNDSYEMIKPIDCEIRQLVRYVGNTFSYEVIINQDLLDKMDNVNLAALYLHEAYYTHLRLYGEQSSIRVRRAIGLISSGFVFKPWNDIIPEEYFECGNPYNKAYVFYDKKFAGITGVVSMAEGRKMIGVPRLSQWLVLDELSQILKETSGFTIFGNLGDDLGSDYSYSFKVKPNVQRDELIGSLKLLNYPDTRNPTARGDSLICTLVTK